MKTFSRIDFKPYSSRVGYEFLNKDAVFQNKSPRTFLPPGDLERGFRSYPVKPRFHFSRRLGRLMNDFQEYSGYWLISHRAKVALSTLSENDFEFLELEIETDPGVSMDPVWLCEVMPVLDAVILAQSNVEVLMNDRNEPWHRITSGTRLTFDTNAIGEHHVFRLKYNVYNIICDNLFRSVIKNGKLTGLVFRQI